MKNLAYVYAIVVFSLYGCQTPPPAAEAPPEPVAPVETTTEQAAATPDPAPEPPADPSSIATDATGFSPKAQFPNNSLSFSLHFGKSDKVVSWTVDLAQKDGAVVKVFQDDAPRLPPTLSWDGNRDDGSPAPEGTYTARLSVNYGEKDGVATVESSAFLVDLTPPSGSIVVTPQPFEQGDPDRMVNPPEVKFQIQLVEGAAPIVSWRLGVMHPDGRRFMDFISEDHRDNTVTWNGKTEYNAPLEAGVTYDLVAQVFDRYGNVGTVHGSLEVAQPAPPVVETPQPTPVTMTIDGELVAQTQVFFPPFSSDLNKVDAQKAGLNAQAIAKLVSAIEAVPDTKIKIIGHANKVFWNDKTKGDLEQTEVLLPLSEARAQAVRDALVAQGLDAGRFELSGVGAEEPVADFSDQANNWKNRRVEFVVEN